MSVTVSDCGRALCAIEGERKVLYAEARKLSEEQAQILWNAQESLTSLGLKHLTILKKLAALDEAADKVRN